MSIRRIPRGDRRILPALEEAWIAPESQDVLTEDIIKWLRLNLHREDVGLWVIVEEGDLVGAMIAFGPNLINKSTHVYVAWIKPGAKANAKQFFEGDFEDWVRANGSVDVTMNSSSHSARVWQRKFGFVPYSRVYIKRLESAKTNQSALASVMEMAT